MSESLIAGQLNERERQILVAAIGDASPKPRIAMEVGTWLGGGSTLHLLRALEKNGTGHLWGIEADRSIYQRMLASIRGAAPVEAKRFTPLFGFSKTVIPQWLAEQPRGFAVDFVFLDGGNRPLEQVEEFHLLNSHIPVGGQLLAHDAQLRKGKWLVPYLMELDNWQVELHNVSVEGLLAAKKISSQPSPDSLRRARWTLLRLRSNPVEVLAAILPSSLCGFVLRLLPGKFSRLLSDGRK